MPVDRIKLGQAVRSLAGRDAGRLYLVVGFAAPTSVLVADGRGRGAAKPKKKNIRHLGVLKYVDEGVAARVAGGAAATDLELRAALRSVVGTDNSDADEEGDSCPSKML